MWVPQHVLCIFGLLQTHFGGSDSQRLLTIQCPYGANTSSPCYFLYRSMTGIDCNTAQRYCRSKEQFLIVIANPETQKALETLVNNRVTVDGLWTGGRRSNSTKWSTLDGRNAYIGPRIRENNLYRCMYVSKRYTKLDYRASYCHKNLFKYPLCQVNRSDGCLSTELAQDDVCYHVIKKRTSWYGAYKACRALNKNSKLSTLAHTYIHTKAFQTLINQKTTFLFNSFWVGYAKNIWLWKNNEAVGISEERTIQHFNWDPSGTAGSDKQDNCLFIEAPNYGWDGKPCSGSNLDYFVCQTGDPFAPRTLTSSLQVDATTSYSHSPDVMHQVSFTHQQSDASRGRTGTMLYSATQETGSNSSQHVKMDHTPESWMFTTPVSIPTKGGSDVILRGGHVVYISIVSAATTSVLVGILIVVAITTIMIRKRHRRSSHDENNLNQIQMQNAIHVPGIPSPGSVSCHTSGVGSVSAQLSGSGSSRSTEASGNEAQLEKPPRYEELKSFA